MADNMDVTPGSGKSIAADEIASVLYQRIKPTFGVDGSATDVSSSNPLPVVQTGTPALPTGAATESTLSTLNGKVTACNTGAVVLAAGTASIGKLAANSGVDIGDVDVTSLPALAVGDNAIGRVKLTDGTDVADILDLTNSNPLTVAIVDGSGTQITSFGGGTQYTEGDTDASITGTAMLWEDAGNALSTVSASKPLPVVQTGTPGLPTGASTAANQTTIIGHVDGIETLLGTIDADTSTLAGAVSGTEMQVDVVAALPAGTNNIGDVDIASITAGDNTIGRVKLTDGTDVADILDLTNSNPLTVAIVDGSGTQITSFGGGTQYTEGDTDASITGTAMLWEDTSDTLRAVSSAKPLPVNVVSGSTSGTEYTEDAAAAANPAGGMLMAVRADSLAAVTDTDGDNIALRSTNKGELYVKQTDAVPVTDNGGTLSIDDGGGIITVDGTVAATQSGTWNVTNVSGTVSLPTGASTAANQSTLIGHVDGIEGLLGTIDTDTGNIVTSVQLLDDAIVTDDAAFTPATTKVMMAGFEFDDSTPDSVNEGDAGAARMSANRNIYTQIRDAAGNERGANVNASSQLSVSVDNTPAATISGNVAHDTADSGNPVKVGGVARTSNPTAVASGDRVDAFHDDVGRQIVVLNQCRDLTGVQQTTITSSTSETTIVTAGGASVFRDITQLTITNSSASALIVTLKDSTAGTTRGIYALQANGGIAISFPTPLAQGSSNANWTLTCGSSVASIYVVAQYVNNV